MYVACDFPTTFLTCLKLFSIGGDSLKKGTVCIVAHELIKIVKREVSKKNFS